MIETIVGNMLDRFFRKEAMMLWCDNEKCYVAFSFFRFDWLIDYSKRRGKSFRLSSNWYTSQARREIAPSWSENFFLISTDSLQLKSLPK